MFIVTSGGGGGGFWERVLREKLFLKATSGNTSTHEKSQKPQIREPRDSALQGQKTEATARSFASRVSGAGVPAPQKHKRATLHFRCARDPLGYHCGHF